MRYLTFALAKGRLAKTAMEMFEKIGIQCEEMKDEKTIDISLKERIRLDKSYINYHDIIDKNLPYKFAYLD